MSGIHRLILMLGLLCICTKIARGQESNQSNSPTQVSSQEIRNWIQFANWGMYRDQTTDNQETSIEDQNKRYLAPLNQNETLLATALGHSSIAWGEFNNAGSFMHTAALHGDAEAQFCLGKMLLNGQIAEIHGKPTEWLEKAADQNHGQAALLLGKEFELGKVVPLDSAKAFELFRKSFSCGCAEAELYLGLAYFDGIGCKTDIEKGLELIANCTHSEDKQLRQDAEKALEYCTLTARLAVSPEPSKVLLARSEKHLNDRYGEKSTNDVRRAIVTGRGDAIAHLRLARHFFEQNEFVASKELCEKVIESDKKNAEAWLIRGICFQNLGERESFLGATDMVMEHVSDGSSAVQFASVLIDEAQSLLKSLHTSKTYTGDIFDDEIIFDTRLKRAVDLAIFASGLLDYSFENDCTEVEKKISCVRRRRMFEKIHDSLVGAYKFETGHFTSFTAGERAQKLQNEFFALWTSLALYVIGDDEHNRQHLVGVLQEIKHYWRNGEFLDFEIKKCATSTEVVNQIVGKILDGCKVEFEIGLKGVEQAKYLDERTGYANAVNLSKRVIHLLDVAQSHSLKAVSGEHIIKSVQLVQLVETFEYCDWEISNDNWSRIGTLQDKLRTFDLK